MSKKPCLLSTNTLVFDGKKSVELSDFDIPIKFEYTDKFSISFWMKTESLRVSCILSKMTNSEPYVGWDVLLNDVDELGCLRFQLIHSYPNNWIEVRSSVNDILDNTWHHVMIYYGGKNNANQIKIFVDSKERPIRIISDCLDNSTVNSLPITIGSRSKGGIEFNGMIRGVELYFHNLSKSEIESIFQSSLRDENDSKKILKDSAIILRNVTKKFYLHHNIPSTIFERISNMFKNNSTEEFFALKNINLEIKHGEMIGIIGRNGGGKSTLLKIMSGVLEPTSGEVIVNGKATAFLSLGSGFNPQLDAIENIILYGMLLGASKNWISSQVKNILKFAELEHFSDVKLKDFSSGMFMRLAFSVAISLDPDIILIDEVLAVGDASFQQKSFQKLLSFKNAGKSIVIVTHNLEHVLNLCDRAVFIQNGNVESIGKPDKVVELYRKSLN